MGAMAPGAGAAVLQNSTWAGYAADSGTYTSVSASWVQPGLTCGSQNTYSADWVGLDGISNSALEQTGTEADCIDGTARYGAWWEVLPAAESAYSVSVKPGDHITASVAYEGSGRFTMTLSDTTQGWTKTTTHAGSAGFQNTSAEIVSEAQTVSGSIAVINSGTITFTSCLVNGSALGDSDPDELVTPDSTVSPIQNGESFSVTWGTGGGGVLPGS
jgi:hypothetical protein